MDVWASGEFADGRGPGVEFAGRNFWFCHMVENEFLVGETCYELDGGRQLPRIDENVVRKIELSQRINASEKVITKHEAIIRFGLNDVPKAAERFELAKIRKTVGDIRRHEIDPPHNAQNRGIVLCKIEKEVGFRFRLRRLNGNAACKIICR